MRTADTTQHGMFSSRTLEERIPRGHPLRKLRILVDEIRKATNGNYALGNTLFAEQVAAELGRRVVRGKAGWPVKKEEPESGRLFG